MAFLRPDRLNSKTDEALVSSYQATGDGKYLGVLYDRYLHLVYGLCLKYLKSREDSQDATMAIYEQITTSLMKTEVTYFKSWLYVVAKNHCLMELRKRQRHEEKNVSLLMEYDDAAHPNEVDIDDKIEGLTVCLEQLKDLQQRTLSLFYLQKQSYQQVAAKMSIDLKTVKSAIQNGKRNLKICIEERRKLNNE